VNTQEGVETTSVKLEIYQENSCSFITSLYVPIEIEVCGLENVVVTNATAIQYEVIIGEMPDDIVIAAADI